MRWRSPPAEPLRRHAANAAGGGGAGGAQGAQRAGADGGADGADEADYADEAADVLIAADDMAETAIRQTAIEHLTVAVGHLRPFDGYF